MRLILDTHKLVKLGSLAAGIEGTIRVRESAGCADFAANRPAAASGQPHPPRWLVTYWDV